MHLGGESPLLLFPPSELRSIPPALAQLPQACSHLYAEPCQRSRLETT